MIAEIKRWVLCPVGLHTGHVRVEGGMMWFHCTRCGVDVGERSYDPLQFRSDGSQTFGEWSDE